MSSTGVGGPARGAVARFDEAVDAAFERYVRGHPAVDAVMYAASAAGDHGMLWLALAALQQARRRARGESSVRPLVRAAAGITIESALVNGPIKWMFRRSRPSPLAAPGRYLRQPRTSSFPSGHATSAFCSAALLRDGDPLWWAYYLVAAVVATSRVHVRIHHASDVVAGVVMGAILGEIGRRLVPLSTPDVGGG